MHAQKIKFAIGRMLPVARRFQLDVRGVSAIEFAFILPILLILLVITLELSNAFSLHRKITIAARSLSDLISQSTSVSDSDLTNSFTAGSIILEPYSSTPLQAIISEVKVDTNGKATIVWTKSSGYGKNPRNVNDVVAISPALAVPNTYLIWGEASYTYTPILDYLSSATLPLGSQFFTRPRQSVCVIYNTTSCP
jgi:Flp pilus assembly protein TadG